MVLCVHTFLGEGFLVGKDTLKFVGEIEDLAQDEMVEIQSPFCVSEDHA
jgi:hypothetical protein